MTTEDIARVTVFAGLGEAERERLSRAAADIRLAPGEYAAHQGSERALFAVLEGRIEAVKIEDGIETPVGVRNPGDVFGEVPISFGTVFPVGFRAAEASRVIRVEPADYHAVASVVPDVGKRSAGWRPTASADRAGCRASPPSRRRPARSWSGTAWMRPAPSCDGFSTATRSRSDGSRPRGRIRRTGGAARYRPKATGRRFAWPAAARS